MQDRKFRACCCPRFFVKLQRKFVFYIVPAGLIEYVSESRKITKRRYLLSSVGRPRRSSPTSNKTKKEDVSNERPTARQRSSPIISRIQKYQHSQTLLVTQIRNFLRKWHPGSMESKTPTQRPQLRSLQANQDDKVSLQKANWQSCTWGRKIW